jgi:predicted DNA-binding protein
MDKTINFKVDAELYKKIKVKVAQEDKTIKGYVIELIEKDLERQKKETPAQ